MKNTIATLTAIVAAAAVITAAQSAPLKVDLSKETVGKPPVTFEAGVGTWLIAQDGAEKVVMVDGGAWKSAQTNAGKMLIENARKLYGTTNEELMDNAKQFANYPVAVLKGLDNFSNGTISMKFKTVAGDSDRASGILFNVKPNGDWLSVRYNDPETNMALWEFHNGIRRRVVGTREGTFPLDRTAWHEMVLTIDGDKLTTTVDGKVAIEYTLGTPPGPGRGGAAPNDDLFPDKNPVLKPPVMGRVGLWSKGDSTSYFKDFVVTTK